MLWSKDECKHVISYDGTNISFSGIEGPEEIKFKVASFQIKKDMLQPAIDIAQMYDLYRYSNCQKIQQFPKDSPERAQFILESTKNEERLLEFLTMLKIAIARPSEYIEKALADWIAFTFAKKIREEAPLITEKVRAGEVVRESPPLEEYNRLKRNITNAKMSSSYLKEALEHPHFDINEVYTT